MGWLHGVEDICGRPGRPGALTDDYTPPPQRTEEEEKHLQASVLVAEAERSRLANGGAFSPDGQWVMTVNTDGYPEKVSVKTYNSVGPEHFCLAPWGA